MRRVLHHPWLSTLVIRGLLAVCALVLVLAPIPIHACLQADSDECMCCCSHDAAAPLACCVENVPTDSDCCFTLNFDTGPLVPLLRDTAPPVSTTPIAHAVAPQPYPGIALRTEAQTASACSTAAQRRAILCSFLI